jgi:hypothetical protein
MISQNIKIGKKFISDPFKDRENRERAYLSDRLMGLFKHNRKMILADRSLRDVVLYEYFGMSIYMLGFPVVTTAGEAVQLYSNHKTFSDVDSDGELNYATFFADSPLSGSMFSCRFCPHSKLSIPDSNPDNVPEEDETDFSTSSFGSKRDAGNLYKTTKFDFSAEGYWNLVERCFDNLSKDDDAQRERDFWTAYNIILSENPTTEQLLWTISCDITLFEKIPARHQTPELCEYVLERKNYYFRLFRNDLKSEKLCLRAVELLPSNIQYVQKQTKEMCNIAIENEPETIQYVHNQNIKLCLRALFKEPRVLKYIREQTEELCLFAVMSNPKTLQYVKEQTPRISHTAVSRRPKCIAMLNEQTPELCRLAVKKAPSMKRLVKDKSMLETNN